MVIDIFNNLDEFLKHGNSLRVIVFYYLYSLPTIFVQVVPVAVLVAVLYMLGNLNRHNEILALEFPNMLFGATGTYFFWRLAKN